MGFFFFSPKLKKGEFFTTVDREVWKCLQPTFPAGQTPVRGGGGDHSGAPDPGKTGLGSKRQGHCLVSS